MEWDLSAWKWVIWNVFLAAIPVATAYALSFGVSRWTVRKRIVPWWVWLPLCAVWLAFLPNTCYLLTEWRHFLFDEPMPDLIRRADMDRGVMLGIAKWGLFFLVYSGIGAASFVLSIRPIHRLIRLAKIPAWFPGAAFFLLTSFGVYLGLIVRLNSWDIVHRPRYVWEVSVQAIENPTLVRVVVVFAFLLWLLYLTGDVWMDGLAVRMGRLKGTDETKRKAE
jgi:uncharacterized membrane protein